MQWEDSANAGFTTGTPFTEFVQGKSGYQHLNVANQLTDESSLFHVISRMIHVRKQHHVFGRGTMEWIDTGNPSLAAYTRQHENETILVIHNLSAVSQRLMLPAKTSSVYLDLLSNREQRIDSEVSLQPYAYYWLK